jgi:ADP-heptose:LPS heptosyltransferase
LKVKFLVIRFSSIGDIVLTSPVLRCLKEQVAGSEIHYLTKKKFAQVVSANPHIDKLHLLDNSMKDLKIQLRRENFDYIIDLHNNIRSTRIKSFLRIPSFTFNKLNLKKYILVNFNINLLPDKHIVDRYLETLKEFKVENDNLGLDFFIPDGHLADFSQFPLPYRESYVAFVISGTWNTKKLPVQKVAEICSRINHPVILLGGKNEQEQGAEISELLNGKVLDLTGKTTLYQSADIVRRAQVVIANDTGLMHIAAAYKKKILSFWGNTTPLFGMYPYMPDPASQIMEVDGLTCRPCSKLGYRKCPNKHFKCMQNQNTDKAVEWIKRNLQS